MLTRAESWQSQPGRAKPRLKVLRGYGGNETNVLTHSATPKIGEAILSGMLISLDSNGQWVKGLSATNAMPYLAYHDQTDTDVQSSQKLLGLSCAGDYEVQTGYFDNTDTYVEGSPVIADATAGSVGLGTFANTGAAIIGFCTRGGRVNLGGTNNAGQNSEATPGSAGEIYVLTFVTRWTPVTT